jgi:hypothetical protein
MAKAPVSEEILKEQFGPHLNYKPPGGWKRRIRTSSGEASQNTLLLLRTAVRNPIKGPRKSGDRVRALGGVPL